MLSQLLTLTRAAFVSTTLFLVACSDPMSDGALGVASSAIVYGEPSDESEDMVVDVYARVNDNPTNNTLLCTGTLIAPNVMLTALHCVTYRDDPNAAFVCGPDGTLTSGVAGAGELGATVDPEGIEVFVGAVPGAEPAAHGARVFGSGSMQICRGDIAAVVLDGDITQAPAMFRFGRGVTLGERMTVIGYGQAEVSGPAERRRRTGRRVLDIGATGGDPGTGTAAPNTYVLGEGACHGDSGGPAIAEETGAITGVYSLTAAASCTSTGVRNAYTLVSPYESTIRAALEYAGHEPIVEEDPTPDAGTGGGETGGSGGSMSGSGGTDTGGTDTGGTDTGGSSGTSGTSGTEGDDDDGGTTGEGSGSRRSGCACRAGSAARSSAGWAILGFAAFVAVRRRRRSA